MNNKQDLMTFYTNVKAEGNIVVLLTDRTQELDRIERTELTDAIGTIWCEGGILLYYDDRIMFVTEDGLSQHLNIDIGDAGIACY